MSLIVMLVAEQELDKVPRLVRLTFSLKVFPEISFDTDHLFNIMILNFTHCLVTVCFQCSYLLVSHRGKFRATSQQSAASSSLRDQSRSA